MRFQSLADLESTRFWNKSGCVAFKHVYADRMYFHRHASWAAAIHCAGAKQWWSGAGGLVLKDGGAGAERLVLKDGERRWCWCRKTVWRRNWIA